jgi:N-acetylmuramoyl-L-alanine amidase
MRFRLRPPKRRRVRRSCLDAGHGGEDGGAVGVNGVEEKALNLAIALHVQEELQHAGYPVVMVRDTDTAVGDTTLATIAERKRSDIQYRAQLVNETENCILVSIHQNFFEQSQYSGAQMFYSPNIHAERRACRSDPPIRRRAGAAGKHPGKQAGRKRCLPAEPRRCSRRYRRMRVYLESGGSELLCDSAYQQKLAAAIADGVLSFCAAE